MVGSNRVRIVFILILFAGTFVFGQEKQDKEDKQLREEILSIYKSGGEQGLRDFVKKKNMTQTGQLNKNLQFLKTNFLHNSK